MRIVKYKAVADSTEIIEAFGDKLPDSATFFNRIADYAVAADRCRIVNDWRANLLQAVAGH